MLLGVRAAPGNEPSEKESKGERERERDLEQESGREGAREREKEGGGGGGGRESGSWWELDEGVLWCTAPFSKAAPFCGGYCCCAYLRACCAIRCSEPLVLAPPFIFGGVFAQRGHSANYYVVYPGNTPENHPPTEGCMINSKQHWVQNSGPWEAWQASETSCHIALAAR